MIDEHVLDVNEHGVLRIPAALWLALVLQCRHWVLGGILLLSARYSQNVWYLLTNDFGVFILSIEIPGLLSLIVCTQRQPKAGKIFRDLWHWVPYLAAFTCIAHLGYAAWYLWNSTYWLPWPELAIASVSLIDIVILLALFNNKYWLAVWREFPVNLSKSSNI